MKSLTKLLSVGAVLLFGSLTAGLDVESAPLSETLEAAGQRPMIEPEYGASYEITIPADNRQIAIVKASLIPIDRELYMFPGANQFPARWSTFVSNLEVNDKDENLLPISAMEDGTWQLSEMPQGRITISYQVNVEHETHAWSGGVDGAAYAREWGVFFTARSLFIVNGEVRKNISVAFHLPRQWRVTAPWQKQVGNATHFTVADHEVLATSMFFAGTHKEVSVRHGQFELLLALGGEHVSAQEEVFVDMAKGVLDYYTDLMGDVPRLRSRDAQGPPVVIINEGAATDGEAIGNNISMLLEPADDQMSRTIAQLIFAHEFFHLWNGKSFAPSGDDAEWFKEGFSNFYTLKALHHIGYLTDESYLELLANFFYQRYDGDDAVGRLSMTNGELKHDHWGLIYSGGLFVAIAQDLQIRSATGNQKSLDDLMRFMFDKYADSSYDSTDIKRALSDLNNASQEDFFNRYIFGAERLPVSQYLILAGIETRQENGQTAFEIQEDPAEDKSDIRRGLFSH